MVACVAVELMDFNGGKEIVMAVEERVRQTRYTHTVSG